MPAPATLAAIGALRPNTTTASLTAAQRSRARFANLRAWRRGQMPEVAAGQVWADQDPRCQGRTVQVVAVHADDRVTVQTLTARTGVARTPAASAKDTVGSTTKVSLRCLRHATPAVSAVSGRCRRRHQCR